MSNTRSANSGSTPMPLSVIASCTSPKAVSCASIRITGLQSSRRNLSEVQLAITDNGIGVEPEFADRVFDMFYRLHDEDEYAGVGIGLAVCRKIVGDHGGRIWIDKAYTGGTRVLMTLPAIEEAVAPEPRKQAA